MRRNGLKTIVASLLLLAFTFPASADTYSIDTPGAHASITFRIQHLGYSWLTGRFDTFEGEFSFDPADPAASKIVVQIDPASINTNHAKRDEHLRNADFLDVANHPEARFESTEIEVTGEGQGVIRGDLTIRGVTRSVEIATQYVGGGDDPWGGFRQGFTGTTAFKPADFGMPHPVAGQTVFLTLDVEGIRQ